MRHLNLKSRAAGHNTKNRFEQFYIDYSDENLEEYYDDSEDIKTIQTRYYNDTSKSILAGNESPDLAFNYSINPYRGCEHGCIYCYARPSHEYLGFSAGLDFETRIMVKRDAAKLLEKEFSKKSWVPQSVMFSGNTDCYQQAERKLGITRECLEVFLKFRNPAGMITKNALILRDLDLLKQLAELHLVTAAISITTLNRELSRKMEPRTSVPAQRLETIEKLSNAGIHTGVIVAPVIPGLTDSEIPGILKAAAQSGAKFAAKTILRLPYSVKELFINWLNTNYPGKSQKVINRIKDVRGGKLTNPEFGKRMSGEGEYAEHIHRLFRISCTKYGLNRVKIKIRTDLFTRSPEGQGELFG